MNISENLNVILSVKTEVGNWLQSAGFENTTKLSTFISDISSLISDPDIINQKINSIFDGNVLVMNDNTIKREPTFQLSSNGSKLTKSNFTHYNLSDISKIKNTASNFKTMESGAFEQISTTLQEFDSKSLTAIPWRAFYFYPTLNTVKLNNVKKIENNAFERNPLSSFEALSVIDIGNYTFNVCNKISSFDFPELSIVGNGTFANCSQLTSFNAPKLLSSYNNGKADYLFANCSQISSINLSNFNGMGKEVFKYCRNLLSVYLNSATAIGISSFLQAPLKYLNVESLESSFVQENITNWCIPSGCTIQCKDGMITT